MHRVAQFIGHVTARVSPNEAALAHTLLPGAALPLFDGMPVADRRHALDVVHRLLAAGIDDRDLLAAALLHDAAKGHRLRLWHRVAGVLMERFAPMLLRRLASTDPAAGGYAWHLYLHHEILSADAAGAAGLSPRAVAFIRGEVPDTDRALWRAFHAADEES
jgi:hypothetical protein